MSHLRSPRTSSNFAKGRGRLKQHTTPETLAKYSGKHLHTEICLTRCFQKNLQTPLAEHKVVHKLRVRNTYLDVRFVS